MTRSSFFEILRKIDLVLIVISIIAAIVFGAIGLYDAFFNPDFGSSSGDGEVLALILSLGVIVPLVMIMALLIDRLILRALSETQSTALILIIIILQVASGLVMQTISIPLLYIIALFLPKE